MLPTNHPDAPGRLLRSHLEKTFCQKNRLYQHQAKELNLTVCDGPFAGNNSYDKSVFRVASEIL